jgi:hypothetical protein
MRRPLRRATIRIVTPLNWRALERQNVRQSRDDFSGTVADSRRAPLMASAEAQGMAGNSGYVRAGNDLGSEEGNSGHRARELSAIPREIESSPVERESFRSLWEAGTGSGCDGSAESELEITLTLNDSFPVVDEIHAPKCEPCEFCQSKMLYDWTIAGWKCETCSARRFIGRSEHCVRTGEPDFDPDARWWSEFERGKIIS